MSIIKSIIFSLKRFQVKLRMYEQHKEKVKAYSQLKDEEQRAIFELVLNASRIYPDKVRHDKLSGETIIIQRNILITLNSGKVSIDNHTGFHTEEFENECYGFLLKQVEKNAHRYTRKLKYEVRMNLRAFLLSAKNELDNK